MTRLNQLFQEQQQSPWIDNLKRSYITTGSLKQMINDGIRGVTSNPSIFQKSISSSSDYDDQFFPLISEGKSVEEAYWQLVIKDVSDACDEMLSVYDQSDHKDGFVSIEVSPLIANEETLTTSDARHLSETIDRPNLMVKIPATKPCLASIKQMISEARNINVTLIFSIERYAEVIEAYIGGLENCELDDLSQINSVASFFISRVDSEVDNRLNTIGSPESLQLLGKAAIAQAKLAYQLFLEKFSGPRWEALAKKGANVQRPLWASTSTKNPNYPDLLYVDSLIGNHTVNTMPDSVVDAYLDHGTIKRTIDINLNEERDILINLEKVGIDLEDVANTLEDQGVKAFQNSFNDLLSVLSKKTGEAQ